MRIGTILVTDGGERAALAVVRSLGRHGYQVVVCSARTPSLAGASKYAIADVKVPDPVASYASYADAIGDVIRRFGVDVLLPISEASLLAILPVSSRYAGVCVPMPTLASFRQICDKAEVLRVAPELGISIPAQHVLTTRADAAALMEADVALPVVLKPSRSVGEAHGRRLKLGVSHITTKDEFRRTVSGLGDAAFPLLVQQRISGPGIGVFLLVWKDEPIAVFCHRRIREKPPTGGVSVYRESVAADSHLVARSRALLDRFSWQGVAMVEYKVDATSGEAYLMEVNGRFWGSLQLAIDAGVDFPSLLVDVAQGRRVEPVLAYSLGVRSRWFWGDVDHLLACFRASRADRSLLDGFPSRWRALREFLTHHPGIDREEIFRLSDPLPFFRETQRWLRRQ